MQETAAGIGWVELIFSGVVATVLAVSLLGLVRSFGLSEFSVTVQIGCLFRADPRSPATDLLGFVLLLVAGSTVGPLLYLEVLRRWGEFGWRAAVGLGFVQGTVAVLLFPALGRLSGCVRGGATEKPGWFGLNWGRGTPAGVIAGSMLYGAALGALLGAF